MLQLTIQISITPGYPCLGEIAWGYTEWKPVSAYCAEKEIEVVLGAVARYNISGDISPLDDLFKYLQGEKIKAYSGAIRRLILQSLKQFSRKELCLIEDCFILCALSFRQITRCTIIRISKRERRKRMRGLSLPHRAKTSMLQNPTAFELTHSSREEKWYFRILAHHF